MGRTWLIIDVPSVCYRNFNAHNGDYSGVKDLAASLRRDLNNFMERFSTSSVAFCFDSNTNLRKEVYPPYKLKLNGGLKESTVGFREFVNRRNRCAAMISELRDGVLTSLGFKNVFHQEGYEADDLIASCCHNLGNNEKAVVASDDYDMFQLIGPDVEVYLPRPKELIGGREFAIRYWNCYPEDWVKVKAIAGCESDNVAGVKGVGEKKAVQFLLGEMDRKTQTFGNVTRWIQSEQYKTNLQLVRLPYPGTLPCRPQLHQAVSDHAWEMYLYGEQKRTGG